MAEDVAVTERRGWDVAGRSGSNKYGTYMYYVRSTIADVRVLASSTAYN